MLLISPELRVADGQLLLLGAKWGERVGEDSVLLWLDSGLETEFTDSLEGVITLRMFLGESESELSLPFSMKKDGEMQRVRVVPQQDGDSKLNVLGGKAVFTAVRGSIELLYEADVELELHVFDADGTEIPTGKRVIGSKILDDGKVFFREMLEIQSFREIPECISISTDADGLFRVKCRLIPEK